jgi:ribosomal protein S18 acetylase RimI-like enzyme
MLEGRVVRVNEPSRKARILSALMARFQPEGGYAPITPEDKRYTKVLEELLVAELVPARVSAKRKLGQHRSRAQIERVLEGLWRRGAPCDLRAMRLIREAHPERPLPALLRGPHDSVLCAAPDAQDAQQVAQLLEGHYWTQGMTRERLARAQLGSPAWVVARDGSGAVVASARAISDGARLGWVMDVVVRPELRGRGFGTALMRLLLDHPALRDLAVVGLRTRDAQRLYESLGFRAAESAETQMKLVRG